MKDNRIEINTEQCNRNIQTYGDVIRHMTNKELTVFLCLMGAETEAGVASIMAAKAYLHRHKDNIPEDKHMYSFLGHSITRQNADYFEYCGIENWHDLCQWECEGNKNK